MTKPAVNHALCAILGGGVSVRRSESEQREQKAAIFGLRSKSAEPEHTPVVVQRFNDEQQIVYGCVYAPGVLDTYGEFMTAEDIETMAHRYMRSANLSQTIDAHHDNVSRDAYPVESFIARKGDPDYPEGSWVLGVKVNDIDLWSRIKSGELNGFSFQAMVVPVEMDVEYQVMRDHVGPTETSADHSHMLFVQLGADGKVTGGRTSKAADGHFHEIKKASATEKSSGHSHRYFL